MGDLLKCSDCGALFHWMLTHQKLAVEEKCYTLCPDCKRDFDNCHKEVGEWVKCRDMTPDSKNEKE